MFRESIKYIVLGVVLFFAACSKNDSSLYGDGGVGDASILAELVVSTSRTLDANATEFDQTFSSLALFVFDGEGGLDKAAQSVHLLEFTTAQISQIVPLHLSVGEKKVYLIANYDKQTFSNGAGSLLTLGAETTQSDLLDLNVVSSNGLDPSALPMVAVETLTINEGASSFSFESELRRLTARVDLHFFKDEALQDANVVVQKVTLGNRVLNSEITFDYSAQTAQLLTSPLIDNESVTLDYTAPLYASQNLNDLEVDARFYSYQNIADESLITAPFLTVDVTINGVPHSYRAYLTDEAHNLSEMPYSILQNNLYRITAIIQSAGNLSFTVEAIPLTEWQEQQIECNKTVHYLKVSQKQMEITDSETFAMSILCDEFIDIVNLDVECLSGHVSNADGTSPLVTEDLRYPSIRVSMSNNSGTITVTSDLPINYASRKITFTITSPSGLTQDIELIQNPPIVITSRPSTGNIKPDWAEGGTTLTLFTINMLCPDDSGSNTLGDPTGGTAYTLTDEASNKIVSPQFIIASQYGIYGTLTYDEAQTRCYQYGEDIYRDAWRMPTTSEMALICTLRSDYYCPIKNLFGGASYWTAHKYSYYNFVDGAIYGGDETTTVYVRAVYDLYKYEGSD